MSALSYLVFDFLMKNEVLTWQLSDHGLDCEGLVAVLGEHGDQGVQHDRGLGQVSGSHLEEDVLGVKGRSWEECNQVVHTALLGDWMLDLSP